MIIKELSKPEKIKPPVAKKGGPVYFFAEPKSKGNPDLSVSSQNAKYL